MHFRDFDDTRNGLLGTFVNSVLTKLLFPMTHETKFSHLMGRSINRVLPVSLTSTLLSKAAASMHDQCDSGEWCDGALLAQLVLALYLVEYPPFHPMISLQLLFLAKTLWNGLPTFSDTNASTFLSDVLNEGLKRCEVTYGRGSHIYAEFMSLKRFLALES
jgi:hypothetical protein